MSPRRLLPLGALVAALAFAGAAQAQPKTESKEVSALVEDGKFAFDKERYSEALRAFDECFRLTKDPRYLWNVALTAERAYWASDQPRDLQKAIAALRQYVKDFPDGKRRAEAAQALKRLEPLAPKPSEGEPAVDPAAPAAPPAARTGVMISSSTPGARIELDGKLEHNPPCPPVYAPSRSHYSPRTRYRSITLPTGAALSGSGSTCRMYFRQPGYRTHQPFPA